MASLEELRAAFSESCTTQFQRLVDDHEAIHRSGFSAFDGQPPTLHAGAVPASGLFCFIERFELPNVTLDVEFGDRESVVEAKLHYQGEPSFAPWEFADAGAVKDSGGLAGSMWVLDVTFMHEVIAAMAASLLESWSLFSNPGAAVLRRVAQRRRAREEANRKSQRGREMERAVAIAAGLFHRSKYVEVERLLAEFAEDPELPPSAKRMVAIARREVGKTSAAGERDEMAQEIERKFLVRLDAWRPRSPGTLHRQGYLSSQKERVVRVRIAGDQAMLTIKGVTVGLTRSEFEYPVPVEDAVAMLDTLCERPQIEKHRHIEVHAGKTWEVDVFHGENEGLVIAELELCSEGEAFEAPAWVGEEVSSDPRYFNSNLAKNPYSAWGR